MHEMSVAMAVLEGAFAVAEREGGGKIAAVHLRIGAVSGVDRDALALALTIAAEGTPAAGANWMMTAVAARAWCGGCGAVREPAADYDLRCRDCGAWLEALREGRELELTAIELENGQAEEAAPPGGGGERGAQRRGAPSARQRAGAGSRAGARASQ